MPKKKNQKKTEEGPESKVLTIPADGGNEEENTPALPGSLPLLPVSQLVLFPHMVAPVALSDESSLHLKLSGSTDNKLITVATLTHEGESDDESLYERVYHTGTAAVILKVMRGPDGTSRVLLHGLQRVALTEMEQETPFPLVKIRRIEESSQEDLHLEALRSRTLDVLKEIVDLSDLPDEFFRAAREMQDPGRLADLIAANVSFKLDEQQELLQITEKQKRLRRTYEMLERLRQVLQIGHDIQSEVRGSIEKNQREFFLREQMKQIRKELGDDVEVPDEIDELRHQLEAKKLPAHAHETAAKEIARLARINTASPEYSVTRTYIDWLLTLPWNELSDTNTDLEHARRVLDEDHYDLKEVKERILEYLAVLKLTDSLRGPILCFVGPPGVGKTSLGRSIARATGREFYRFSLGGMRDEAEIRGHRRTYIGAMPGRIIKAFKQTGTRNPVVMLDEIDKLGTDFRGDPASALLEVLDPEQNVHFSDNYLDLPFDLSKTLFITTANVLSTIPDPLRDRMEIIRLSGYTAQEKLHIAEEFIVPRQAEENGLKRSQIRFRRAALERLIEGYTREAGLREMERQVGRICRKVALRIAQGEAQSVSVSTRNLRDYLGRVRYHKDVADRVTKPGVAVGLAWTQVGGEILFIEANSSPGKGELRMTGQLGDVMKESAQAAMSFLLANAQKLGIEKRRLSERNYHVHIPAGAIPKDGPSAGISIATAIASEALRRPVKKGIAMTGEVTLKGNVLPVGGIKEKVLAASRARIGEVILPKRNDNDFDEIPDEVRKALKFHWVDNVVDVLKAALPGTGEKKKRKCPAGGRKSSKESAPAETAT